MAKIKDYELLDETIRCEFEELWNIGKSIVNSEDVTQITELCRKRGLAKGYQVLSFDLDNGLCHMTLSKISLTAVGLHMSQYTVD